MIKYLNGNKKNFEIKLRNILNKRITVQKNKSKSVSNIIDNIKRNGDKKLIQLEKKFSKVKSNTKKIKFSNQEIKKISRKTDARLKKSIDLAFNRIKKFHEKQKFIPFKIKDNLKNELS